MESTAATIYLTNSWRCLIGLAAKTYTKEQVIEIIEHIEAAKAKGLVVTLWR